MNSGWYLHIHVLLVNYFKGALNEEIPNIGFVFTSRRF